jgi:acetyl-CoA carboxylase biotin carboxyl carrier protein
MDRMKQTGLKELSLQQEDYHLTLKAKGKAVVQQASVQQAVPETAVSEEPAVVEQAPQGILVTSPIVGTFYTAASPDKPPFAPVGKQVQKGDVICIIESMKIMNEVTSEFSGVVTKVLVENGAAVEYGQPLLVIG